MSEKRIPDKIKARVDEIVARFNQSELGDPNVFFSTRYRGKYLYLDRDDYGYVGPRCRLTYASDMDSWKFAIFKYSNERYAPDEWMFPGSEYIDGTIESDLKACVEAYP